jgi:hypothetical protein
MTDNSKFIDGSSRDVGARNNRASRYARNPYDRTAPRLQFGDRGELTPRTITQAGLTGEERKRAEEMLEVQAAYLKIYDCLDFPNDPDGHVVDMSGVHMTQPKVAIAWTLALLGFRPTGRPYIKKRLFEAPGVPAGAYTYVDVRAPDDAAEELRPEDRSSDPHLPPDTRRLAALREETGNQYLGTLWSVTPTVTEEWVDRDAEGVRARTPPGAPPADDGGELQR